MGWGPSTPKPDPSIGDAQESMADLANRQNEFYEQNIAPRVLDQMDQQIDIGKRIADQQLGLVSKYDQRYWDTTAKYQDKFYGLVDKYSAADEQERQAGLARADIAQSMDMQRASQARQMSRMGINPNSGAYVTASRKAATEGALAQAGASTMARQAAKELGMRYTGAAAGMNEGLLGATQSAAGGALAAGGAGLGAAGTAAGIGNQNMQALGGLFNNIGQLGLGRYQGAMTGYAASSNAQGEMIGAGIGALAAMYSDKRLKKNIVKIGTRDDGLGVYEFDYVWGGPRRTGVMSDEVRKVYPHAVTVSGGYDVVDYSKLRS